MITRGSFTAPPRGPTSWYLPDGRLSSPGLYNFFMYNPFCKVVLNETMKL